jgi:hypothetical protein
MARLQASTPIMMSTGSVALGATAINPLGADVLKSSCITFEFERAFPARYSKAARFAGQSIAPGIGARNRARHADLSFGALQTT